MCAPNVLLDIVVLGPTVHALVLLFHPRLEGLVHHPHVLVDVGVLLAAQLADSAGFEVDHLVVHVVVGGAISGVSTQLALVRRRILGLGRLVSVPLVEMFLQIPTFLWTLRTGHQSPKDTLGLFSHFRVVVSIALHEVLGDEVGDAQVVVAALLLHISFRLLRLGDIFVRLFFSSWTRLIHNVYSTSVYCVHCVPWILEYLVYSTLVHWVHSVQWILTLCTLGTLCTVAP